MKRIAVLVSGGGTNLQALLDTPITGGEISAVISSNPNAYALERAKKAGVPGYVLENGSSGDNVRQLQEQINVIAGAYPAIPSIQVDGMYGPATSEAVRVFQSVFGLPQTGTVDYRTWYKISEIYVGVSRIAELT